MSNGSEMVGVVLPRRVWYRIATRLLDVECLLRRFGRTRTPEVDVVRQVRIAADLAATGCGEDVSLL